jgi:hypothetical protein
MHDLNISISYQPLCSFLSQAYDVWTVLAHLTLQLATVASILSEVSSVPSEVVMASCESTYSLSCRRITCLILV